MSDVTLHEAAQALADALGHDGEVRLDLEPVRPAVRLPAPTVTEAVGALDEEAVYRSFASSLGIVDDEPPQKYMTMPRAEYDRLRAEYDRLPDLMRERPVEVSPEEEAEYQDFLRLIGPV